MSFLLIWTTWFFYHQMPDATPEEIKKAYYSCMKACHPDLSGDDPDVTNFCMFINEVYSVRAIMHAACKMFSFCSEICHCTKLTCRVQAQASLPVQNWGRQGMEGTRIIGNQTRTCLCDFKSMFPRSQFPSVRDKLCFINFCLQLWHCWWWGVNCKFYDFCFVCVW